MSIRSPAPFGVAVRPASAVIEPVSSDRVVGHVGQVVEGVDGRGAGPTFSKVSV